MKLYIKKYINNKENTYITEKKIKPSMHNWHLINLLNYLLQKLFLYYGKILKKSTRVILAAK